jgi:hypothetical protein
MSRRRVSRRVSRRGRGIPLLGPIIGMVAIPALIRTLLVEYVAPTPQAFRRYAPASELSPAEKEYVDWAGEHIAWVVRVSKRRSDRAMAVALVSGFSALAVTFSVAVAAPTWVPALLGFVAAAGQFLQGLTRDREQSHLGHQMAIKLQNALRDFHTEAGQLPDRELRRRFTEFRQDFERIRDDYGAEILKIRAEDPPRIATPRA